MTSTTWILMMGSAPANDSLTSSKNCARYSTQVVRHAATVTSSRKLTKFCTRRMLCATWLRFSTQHKRVSHIFGWTAKNMSSLMRCSTLVENFFTSSELFKTWFANCMNALSKTRTSWRSCSWWRKWPDAFKCSIRHGLPMNRFTYWNWC
jgi:hypothetical protein